MVSLGPLYTTMVLGYACVRWWKILTPQECSGVNTFVVVFAFPFLSFKLISSNDPSSMNRPFIAADSVQKLIIFASLFLWKYLSLEWMITLFSLGCVPNTLVIGLPLLRAVYRGMSSSLVIQIMVFQSVIWKTLLLFMFEYRVAKILIAENFPDSAASISSFHVDFDVISLSGCEPLQVNAEIGNDGKLHVVVRKSSSFRNPQVMIFETPISTNLSNGVEVYSLESETEDQLHMFAYGSPAGSSSAHSDDDIKIITEPYVPCFQKQKDGEMPAAPAIVMTKLVLIMVWRKLIRNSNTYSSLLGVAWSLVSSR